MKQTRNAAIALLSVCCLNPFLTAEEKRAMSLVDLLEIPSLEDPVISPDGTLAVFVLKESDWQKNLQVGHLWRIEVATGTTTQMTNGPADESRPAWSPNGETIAFLTQREGDKKKQIYLIGNAGGEARRLTRHETEVLSFSWSPDGKVIYFLAEDPKTKEEKEREKAKDDVQKFEGDYKQRHLWRIDVATADENRVTEGNFSILSFSLSRDGQFIVHHRAPSPLIDESAESEVWIMRADGDNAIRLTENRIRESRARLSPDNQQVLFVAGANSDFETYYNSNLFVVPASGGTASLLLEEMPYEVRSAEWSGDGQSIYFVANKGLSSQLFQTQADHSGHRQLTEGRHNLKDWTFSPQAGLHVFRLDEPSNPGEIWIRKEGSAPSDQRLTQIFQYLEQRFLLPRQEGIQWQSEDGTTIEGLLYYPLNYQQGRPSPLVVQTHGGPAASDRFGFGDWRSYIPVLTARGYLVFKPNYRGSTGYGDTFLRDMVGHYFQNAHVDVMSGVYALIERGLADPERMVKMGWSAGGHMTNKIITWTDRFKAASSGAGAVNWISMYGQSDVRIYRTPWFGGTPWQKDAPIETYWEQSPLSDISKVSTPTLILVGEKDVRVPPPQSVELYRALKSNGVPTQLYIAPREPHGWRELRHRLFKMNVELEWFEKYAAGREYTWETAPNENQEPATD